ncbi:MAG: hypothetical protein WA790_12085 [Sulfitobacter sp.]
MSLLMGRSGATVARICPEPQVILPVIAQCLWRMDDNAAQINDDAAQHVFTLTKDLCLFRP